MSEKYVEGFVLRSGFSPAQEGEASVQLVMEDVCKKIDKMTSTLRAGQKLNNAYPYRVFMALHEILVAQRDGKTTMRYPLAENYKITLLNSLEENLQACVPLNSLNGLGAVEDTHTELAKVLLEALNQSQYGKGQERHGNGIPFMEQEIVTDGRKCGKGSLAFQARKKILEATNCEDDDRAITDLLGAIVYTATMVILRREKQNATNA